MSTTRNDEFPLDLLLRRALDRADEAIAIYTAEQWVIAATVVYVNRALCELSGYEEGHFVGHSALLLGGAKPDHTTFESILPVAPETEVRRRTTKQRPDGSRYVVEAHVSPLMDRDGNVTHYVLTQKKVASVLDSGVFCCVVLDTATAAAG